MKMTFSLSFKYVSVDIIWGHTNQSLAWQTAEDQRHIPPEVQKFFIVVFHLHKRMCYHVSSFSVGLSSIEYLYNSVFV
jgi:hypothetical protein